MPEEKETKIEEWNNHIKWATKEREYYRFLSKDFLRLLYNSTYY